jgi:hypothetical protein
MRNHEVKRPAIQCGTVKTAKNIQMTLRLPTLLYKRAKWHAEREQAGCLNDFIVNALATYVQAVERKAVDDAFRDMAHDKQYQREALRVVDEFGG